MKITINKYIMAAAALFAADNMIKGHIEAGDEGGAKQGKNMFGGRLHIQKYHNTGAMLNIGGRNERLVALLSLAFSAFVSGIFAATLTTKGNVLLKSGLSLLLGGAYSNTYDRLKRQYVVDYVSFRLPETQNKRLKMLKAALESVVFNISDFGIMIGAMLIVAGEMLRKD